MNENSEKRKYKRIKKQYKARLRIKPDEARDMDSKDWDEVALNDLGAGGIYFHVKRELEIGTILDLVIDVSRYYPNIICVGKIVRVHNNPETSINGYAVEFTEIDEQTRKMIDKNIVNT